MQLPGVDFCSGEDIDKTRQLKGPLPKHGLVLLLQRELLLSVVHALLLPRELLQPVEEQLLWLQERELPPEELT